MARRFSFQLNRRLSALTRRRVGLSLQDGKLCAGGMLRLAGFSAGRGLVRAGVGLRERGGSRAGLCSSCGGRAVFTCGVCARWRGGAFVWYYMIVNCGPSKGRVWPVAAPAGGIVRAGVGLRGGAVLSWRLLPSRAWMCFFRSLGKSANPAFPLARAPTIGGRMRAFPAAFMPREKTHGTA